MSVLPVHLVPGDIEQMVVVIEFNERLAGVTTYTTAIHEFTFAVVVWQLNNHTLSGYDFNKPNYCLCFIDNFRHSHHLSS
jgi:hypothetical protein